MAGGNFRLFAAVALAGWQAGVAPAHGQDVASEAGRHSPHRLFVLSDIEADPDDTQSFIRLLLYSNEIDIEGMVATTSVWKRSAPEPDSIRALVTTYGKVQPNLRLHDARYPDTASLLPLIAEGQPGYGMASVGKGRDTPGSVALMRAIEAEDDRPLWISVWGGANTLAQALHSLAEKHSPAEMERLIAKLRVYTISDQDDSGPWLRSRFPGLFYIVSPGGNYGSATWIGIMSAVEGMDNSTLSNAWLAKNIQQGHGPLGASYPDVMWGMEGDTPAFLGLIPNGLSNPDRPDWGGWGGRYELRIPPPLAQDDANAVAGVVFEPETRPIWTDTADSVRPVEHPEFGRATRAGKSGEGSAGATLWRWRNAFQNDFAARMDWTIEPFDKANHPPVPRLQQASVIRVRSGDGIGLSARGTTDPDGDSLSYHWFVYPEAGSYRGDVDIGAENGDRIWFSAPKVSSEETLHIILAVTDKGAPPLTRYARVVVTITP